MNEQPVDYEKQHDNAEMEELRELAEELWLPKKRWWERRAAPMGFYFTLALVALAFFAGWTLG